MSWAWDFAGVLLTLLWLGDALRLRARLAALPALPPSDEPASADHLFVTAPGVTLDDATKRAASAYARREGLQALDLVPGRLPIGRLLGLLQLIDPTTFRADPLARGRTAGHALLLSRDVVTRAGIDVAAQPGPHDFLRLAVRVKHHACRAFGLALAPSLPPAADEPIARRTILEALFGDLLVPVLLFQLCLLSFAGAGALFAPLAGGIAIVVFHLQPALVTLGSPARPTGLPLALLLRSPLEFATALALLFGHGRARGLPDPVEEARPRYEALFAGDPARFHEAPRTSCPLCDGGPLVPRLRTRDLLQHKPGRFGIDRCTACGHLFQNPRLSLEGLGAYYSDFYDGLGEEGLETVFAYSREPYVNRTRFVLAHGAPTAWLDVGTGHGHLPLIGKELSPGTTFHGLDLSESIEHAKARGWVEEGLRGLFPVLAPSLAGRYDVVSMSHYLEHTREPKEELAAAATALKPGGLLFVEVPDPGSPLGTLFGRLWIPWFQPQHQHFVSVESMKRLLPAAGLTPIAWHRGEAHQPVDALFAGMLLLSILSPQRAPWRPKRGLFGTLWNKAVWWTGAPWLALLVLVDRAADPLVRALGWSNTYRVLARKDV